MRVVRRFRPELERQIEALLLLLRSGVVVTNSAASSTPVESGLGRVLTAVDARLNLSAGIDADRPDDSFC